jgi:hypothetical protein
MSQIARRKLMDAVTISSETKYSDSMKFFACTGDATLLIVSTAGTLAISQQCSNDNVAWYDPVNASAAAQGIVKAAQTVTTGTLVTFTPVLSEWIRFKLIESTAPTVVSLTLSYRLEV